MPLLFWFSTSALTLLVFGGIELIPVKPPPPPIKKKPKLAFHQISTNHNLLHKLNCLRVIK